MSNKTLAKSILLLVGLITAPSAIAWVEPTTIPPSNNILAPINSSAFGQSKVGGLILNLGNAAHGLIVRYGLVGIGTDNPQAKLDVRGETKTDSLGVRGDANILGNASVSGSINATGNVKASGVCIGNDCKNAWPTTTSTDTLQSVTARGNTSNGAVNINGDLSFNSTLSTPGRMHINGQEDLYILNKGTTRVSKAWGGTGSLAVEGSLCVGGDCRAKWPINSTWWELNDYWVSIIDNSVPCGRGICNTGHNELRRAYFIKTLAPDNRQVTLGQSAYTVISISYWGDCSVCEGNSG